MRRPIVPAAAIFAAAASTCHADPFWLYDRAATVPTSLGSFFISGNVWGGVQQLPRFRGTASVLTVSGLQPSAVSPELVGAAPGGTIGLVFRDGFFPSGIGQRVRIEFAGNFLAFSARSGASFNTSTGQRYVANRINGGQPYAAGTLGALFRFSDDLRIERDGFRLRLGIAADHAISGDLALTPSLAVHGGRITDSYRYAYNVASAATGFSTGFLGDFNERVHTDEAGLEVGLAAAWQFAPGFTLNMAGAGGVVWQRASLNGQDCYNGAITLPIASGCGSSATYQTTRVADRRSTAGFRGSAALGLSADLRYAVAGLGGFVRFDSHLPGVRNPYGDVAAGTRARLRFAGGIAYGGYVSLRIPVGVGF